MDTYLLPRDTSDLLFKNAGFKPDNTALYTQKYIRDLKGTVKASSKSKQPDRLKPSDQETKHIVGVRPTASYTAAENKLLSELVKSQLDIVNAYKYNHCISSRTGSRMVLGLGSESVFETGITLHSVYGFPYIPGSAVKGCLKNYLIREYFANNEESAHANEQCRKIFGTQENKGGIIFLDVYPKKCDALELDIMNPHYGEYYQGKRAPTDDMNPTPIKFYAVPKETYFTFRVVSDKIDIESEKIGGKTIPEILSELLTEIGLGAKTAVGYGWFRNIVIDE